MTLYIQSFNSEVIAMSWMETFAKKEQEENARQHIQRLQEEYAEQLENEML